MYHALFYKEWVKTRKLILLAVIVFAGFISYSFISIAQNIRVAGAVDLWEAVIMKDFPLIPLLKWVPVLTAVLLSLAQYVPEMHDKRLKLSLHLPLPETGIVLFMLAYGITILLSVYLISVLVLLSGLSIWFPAEFVKSSFYSSAPWFLSGWTAYLLTSWVCLEPVWKYRILNAAYAICALSLFVVDARPGGYHYFMPYLLMVTLISLLFPFYSVVRFKEGAQ